MLVHANTEELERLARCFYDVSRTLLSVYDANKKKVCSYPHDLCQFCTEVRKSPELTEKCLACDHLAFEKCDETHQLVTYKCHMGLLEVAAPIRYNHVTLGYMMFGQITDQRDKSDIAYTLPAIARQYDLDLLSLQEGLQKIKYRSPSYIQSISTILEMCTNYIWQNSFISIKNNAMANSLDMYIKENLVDELSVASLCREFHISRSTLYALSKEYFGCGISEHIQACRLQAAKSLLTESELPIAQIAEMTGIPDANYFTRCFKKAVGMTPGQYRQKRKYT